MKSIQMLGKKRGFITLVSVAFLGMCCGCLALGMAFNSTPGGKATSTARAVALTEKAQPTDTPSPSKTPRPTNTTKPTNTSYPSSTPAPSPTAIKIVLDLRALIGLSLEEARAGFGDEIGTLDYGPRETDSLPDGGKSHLHKFEDYTIYFDADNNGLVRGVSLTDGWEKFNFRPDDWPQALVLVGINISTVPDLSAPLRLKWDNVDGYGVQVFTNAKTDLIASILVYAANNAILNIPEPTAPPTLTATLKPTNIPPTRAPLPTNTRSPIISPTDTQVPQPTGFTLVNLSSPISTGSNANVTIQTVPGASCYLGYTTPAGNTSTAQGLGAATADGNGICSWTWKIGSNTNPGTGSLAVTANGVTQYFQIVIQ